MKTAHDLVAEAKQHIQEIPLAQAEEAIRQADLLVDVRDPDEYRNSHIPGAINISRGLLEFKFTNDPSLENRDLNIVLYCKTSGRAALSAKALKEMGYRNVQSIEGGFDAWQAAGKATAQPELPAFE
ncbi:rhodanese-like domain-containing protein [Marinobacter lutaoensis]|jgi:rhodanese-related sulfurtransferase|uniref:Sulfurtransferase n=1 Tax=Marinobacter lutaoensis TaxID=135739 RepID=A0A1V2DW67_9GAMM|nr:rhodanese-like domain-containing protein [Marinobacter lutaoensis]MBI41920.1 sulfurtransferase [Oceanospirillales bacterium]NVD36507.1 sulfurtransferase [Marinobacter lutaoensis]ONF44868.1 sulfurtransferase [Marinobacter lutaoensis]|tara:strand:- start:2474 stop:2854 length:381 start_codon:yes stop_codon:yes gene_type:complete